MRSLRRGAVVLVLTLALTGCTDIDTHDAEGVSAGSRSRLEQTSASPSARPRSASTTTAPDVQGALTALAHVIRVMFVRPAPPDYHSWPDWPDWQRLGRCEQPNASYPDGIWWDRPGRYEGGLGILNAAWSENNAGLPAHGNQATPAQQIIVGRRIRDRYGWEAWACARAWGH